MEKIYVLLTFEHIPKKFPESILNFVHIIYVQTLLTNIWKSQNI